MAAPIQETSKKPSYYCRFPKKLIKIQVHSFKKVLGEFKFIKFPSHCGVKQISDAFPTRSWATLLSLLNTYLSAPFSKI